MVAAPSMQPIPGGLWVLTSPLVCDTFTVPAGFVTDLATVFRVPLMFLLFGGKARLAAVGHDYLYDVQEIEGRQIERSEADGTFLDLMGETDDPGSAPERMAMYVGVRAGGWVFWNRSAARKAARRGALTLVARAYQDATGGLA